MRLTASDIQQILNVEDVEGLLSLGAPSDEYTSEAEMISEAITRLGELELSQEAVETIVRNVWVKMFGPFTEDQFNKRGPVLSNLARQLLILSQKPPRSKEAGGPRF